MIEFFSYGFIERAMIVGALVSLLCCTFRCNSCAKALLYDW